MMWRAMLQETEDLKLDPNTASQGVAALLNDSAKGRYFVLEVRVTVFMLWVICTSPMLVVNCLRFGWAGTSAAGLSAMRDVVIVCRHISPVRCHCRRTAGSQPS